VGARRSNGFTILEIAIALFIAGLLFGSIFMPLKTHVDSRKLEQTEELLGEAREALLGYATAHGHFPCPADATSAGREPAGTDHVTGTCPTYHGFLPAAMLGFRASEDHGYASDAWGTGANRIRYAVSSQTIGAAGNTNALTRTHGMRTAGISELSNPALSLFQVCAAGSGVGPASCAGAGTLVSTTPVVVWSSGANAATGGMGADEAQNPSDKGGSADRIFVSRVRSNVAGREFDDIVTWIPMPILIARMVSAGQLP
jgi:type II secretory pathway pseudopilin PulG